MGAKKPQSSSPTLRVIQHQVMLYKVSQRASSESEGPHWHMTIDCMAYGRQEGHSKRPSTPCSSQPCKSPPHLWQAEWSTVIGDWCLLMASSSHLLRQHSYCSFFLSPGEFPSTQCLWTFSGEKLEQELSSPLALKFQSFSFKSSNMSDISPLFLWGREVWVGLLCISKVSLEL